ncbi:MULTISPECIES: SMP-30/gluconolactonase/LRE family protein [Subtercola]|uniref:SMP-30/gluconolactonase/LRE family protein n=1 Tax=Subtercola vilae TaxID=2056433 RepID=A0A4T2CEW1_9MICO|nr:MULTISPECIES: SMP-30/gluconolactonase/LRE family protein [Subtercola]MEA9983875.1 SMP-30/gluconolactonase/LRE family protein [Subtercola sp. RTI3]TIH40748.1 SMP-30/gluconolactonase/LRE family protein [Subtercola vilae]
MGDFVSEPRVFREQKAILGESLVWRAAGGEAGTPDLEGDLLWCDITSGILHISPYGGAVSGADDRHIELPAPLASFHLASIDGEPGFVVSLGDRVVLVSEAGVIVRELAGIRHAHTGLRLNEGKVDPAGRWVTGSMNLTTGEPDGAFYSVTSSGEQRVLCGGVGVGNGLEWSADGSLIYFTDTSVETVYVAPYSATGELGEVSVFLNDGPHDGLTRDAAGDFWAALYGKGVVVKYRANGDEVLRRELPAPNLTSVAFGGPGRSTLFVTSARENLTEQQLREHPLSGSVFALDTDSRGVPARSFTSNA